MNIIKYIQHLSNKQFERAEISADKILKEIADIAFNNEDGKKTDQLRALELLGKYKKLFTDKVEHSTPNSIPIEQREQTIKNGLIDMFTRPTITIEGNIIEETKQDDSKEAEPDQEEAL